MKWHLFGALGMMPFDIETDPGLPNFMQRCADEIPGLILHGPYRDYDCNQEAADVSSIPDSDGVLLTGTSLGCCDVPVVGSRTKHIIDGAFGFQASEWGIHQPFTANVKFAHCFNSDIPIPAPGIGSLRWQRGEMTGGCINQVHNIVHPGDYDLNDQMTFIREMKRIIANTSR